MFIPCLSTDILKEINLFASFAEKLMAREEKVLSPYACLNKNSRGRLKAEPECSVRLPFQRDRDRIIHSKTFRRLTHKTQVFLAPTGDHYRTRLTHALEVSQIARTIASALYLNEPLTEAIALGHDLGHTPFGHAGEKALNAIHPGGFRHYEQSLRVVEVLEKKGSGLNLTHEVRDGIAKHSKGCKELLPGDLSALPCTLEGQVVRIADIIAYVNHDLDDAMRANIIKEEQIPAGIRKNVGLSHSARLGGMVLDLITNTAADGGRRLVMSQQMLEHIAVLRTFLHQNVYEIKKVHDDFEKSIKILQELYGYFLEKDIPLGFPEKNSEWEEEIKYQANTPKARKVCDFVAGMTDRYALDLYSTLFFPKPWGVH
jgi:dGTPase